MYFIYAIVSINQKFRYIGFTDNPQVRLDAHNAGNVRSTQAYTPYAMVLIEQKNSSKEARKTEKYYKSGFGRAALNRIIAETDISSRLQAGEIIDLSINT
jgi:putative endonuclease